MNPSKSIKLKHLSTSLSASLACGSVLSGGLSTNEAESVMVKHTQAPFWLLALVVLGLSGCGHQASTMTYHTTGWYTKHLSVAKKLNAKCNQMQSMGTGVVAHDCRNAGIAVLGQPYTE